MMNGVYVGIDTSNYTTSVAASTHDGRVLLNLKRLLPVKDGACGLRQSDALFAHVKQIPELLAELRASIEDRPILGVGCSVRPRDAEGSYMPCFLAGRAAAYALAAGVGCKVDEFSHQSGHLMAALYSSEAFEKLLEAPFAAFHVSGGTTELLYVTPHDAGFSVVQIGGTADLNAGQAIDRAGVMMGLRFPAGKELERFANELPTEWTEPVKVSVKDGVCHLSGLQNLAEDLWKSTSNAALVGQFVFAFIGKTLVKMTEYADSLYPGIPVLYAGGVMSNRYLQKLLSKPSGVYFAEPEFSADNAAGIALLTRRAHQQN